MTLQADSYPMDLYDMVFILSAIAFNLLIVAILITTKTGRTEFRRRLGIVFLLLGAPFGIVFVHRLLEGSDWKLLVALGCVLLYIFVELLLDYGLKVDFRRHAATHIPYIALEYAAAFSLIGISFLVAPVWGWIVSVSFWAVLGSLIFSLWGNVKPAARVSR